MRALAENTETTTPAPGLKRFVRVQRHRIVPPVTPITVGTGQVVDSRYRLLAVLGLGSTGVVYLALDLGLQRHVALKMLAGQPSPNSTVVRFFRQEAVAMASIRHPNVVQVHAFGEHEGLPYLVMDYVDGETLAAYLARTVAMDEPLCLDVVLGLMGQVCRGLQAVHDRGIVHRDIKPANMLVDHEHQVRLIDFGLVASQDPQFSGTLAGSPLYLAPELIRGDAVPDDQLHLCDVYALGVSIYELLTGVGPFEGESIQQMLQAHLHTTPPRVTDARPDLPLAVDAVLVRAMHKDPVERFQSCDALWDALYTARGPRPEMASDVEAPRLQDLISQFASF